MILFSPAESILESTKTIVIALGGNAILSERVASLFETIVIASRVFGPSITVTVASMANNLPSPDAFYLTAARVLHVDNFHIADEPGN